MLQIERTDHLYRLVSEPIEAGRARCAECGDTAPGDRLFIFTSLHGRRGRSHQGAFCCLDCHDIFHGLKPRKGTHVLPEQH